MNGAGQISFRRNAAFHRGNHGVNHLIQLRDDLCRRPAGNGLFVRKHQSGQGHTMTRELRLQLHGVAVWETGLAAPFRVIPLPFDESAANGIILAFKNDAPGVHELDDQRVTVGKMRRWPAAASAAFRGKDNCSRRDIQRVSPHGDRMPRPALEIQVVQRLGRTVAGFMAQQSGQDRPVRAVPAAGGAQRAVKQHTQIPRAGEGVVRKILEQAAEIVAGNMIGAGILALPINTGLAGLLPALVGMLVLGGGMYFSALVLSNEAVAEKIEIFNYPSLYQKYIGATGKWVAILTNMLILYGLLVAYITGAAKIIGDIFQVPASQHIYIMIGFCLVVTLLTVLRTSLMLACMAGLVVFKVAAFGLMTAIAEPQIDVSHYQYANWAYLPATAAILVTAFHFHNIIPNICREMNWSLPIIWKTILLGMLAGFIMNLVWIQVSIGVLPMGAAENGLLWAFQHNLPATVPMSHVLPSRLFVLCGIGFAMVALTTAYMTNGLGLRSFMRDLLVNILGLR